MSRSDRFVMTIHDRGRVVKEPRPYSDIGAGGVFPLSFSRKPSAPAYN
jgi:hypothetical protein